MNKAVTLIEILIVIAILGLLAGIAVGFGGGCSQSEGSRVGTVTKFSLKGIVYKSWEGELVTGGIRAKSDGQAGANIWEFSVADKKVVAQVQDALDHGRTVKLDYKQTFLKPLSRSTTYTVTKVTPVE
jgi:prepilin-type N-terminal cleavage/methylation domain-containing protein